MKVHLAMGLAGALVASAGDTLADSPPPSSFPVAPSSPPPFGRFGGNLVGGLVDYQLGAQEVTSWAVGAAVDMLVERMWGSHWGFFGQGSVDAQGGRGEGQFVLLVAATLDLTAQYQLPVASSHGPILALGVEAQTFQFHPYGWSWFEGPRPEIGYRWQKDGILLRGGAFASLLAGGGTFDTAHGSIASPDYGARLLLAAPRGYATVEARHATAPGAEPGIPVDQVTAAECLQLVFGLQACARETLMRGPAASLRSGEAQWRVWSFEVGLPAASAWAPLAESRPPP
jgi:hypothetical protein